MDVTDDDFSKLLSDYQSVASQNKNKTQEFGKQNNHKPSNNRYQGSGSHTCKTCNYSFKTRQMLFDHLSTHIQCDEDDCDFVGVAQAVAKHKREEHEQGESVQMFAMEHPAVLEAWLQQRRKNFPSSGNIKLKKLREEAKIDFGIVARDKSYTLKGHQWGVKRHKPCIPEEKKVEPLKEATENDPLSFILNPEPKKKATSSPTLLGIGAYNSSSDSDTENKPLPDKNSAKTTENGEGKTAPNVEQMLKKFTRYAKMRGSEGNQKRKRMKWNGVMKSGRRRYQPTLLQRLLSNDITQEHNKMLQCIRYIVNNNFFEDPPIQTLGENSYKISPTGGTANPEDGEFVQQASSSIESKDNSLVVNT